LVGKGKTSCTEGEQDIRLVKRTTARLRGTKKGGLRRNVAKEKRSLREGWVGKKKAREVNEKLGGGSSPKRWGEYLLHEGGNQKGIKCIWRVKRILLRGAETAENAL